MSSVSRRKIDVLPHINEESRIPNISGFNVMIIEAHILQNVFLHSFYI